MTTYYEVIFLPIDSLQGATLTASFNTQKEAEIFLAKNKDNSEDYFIEKVIREQV